MSVGAETRVGLAESHDPLPPVRGGQLARVAGVVVTITVIAGLVLGIAWGGAVWANRGTDIGLRPAQYEYFLTNVALAREGSEFTLGVDFLDHPGEDVTVLSVTPLTSANVDYLGASTVWPRDQKAPFIFGPGAHIRALEVRHPIDEPVPAGETDFRRSGDTRSVFVLASFRLRSGEFGAVNGIQMTYRVGEETFTRLVKAASIACVRPDEVRRGPMGDVANCAPADAEQHWDDRLLHEFGLLPEANIDDDY